MNKRNFLVVYGFSLKKQKWKPFFITKKMNDGKYMSEYFRRIYNSSCTFKQFKLVPITLDEWVADIINIKEKDVKKIQKKTA